MAVDWIWWDGLNVIAFGTEFTGGSGAIHMPAKSPFVAAQLSLSGVTIADTTGFAWPAFTSFTDANGSHPVAGQPGSLNAAVTLSAKGPSFFEFVLDCQNAAALVMFTALGWD
jgi:hypothetical protein